MTMTDLLFEVNCDACDPRMLQLLLSREGSLVPKQCRWRSNGRSEFGTLHSKMSMARCLHPSQFFARGSSWPEYEEGSLQIFEPRMAQDLQLNSSIQTWTEILGKLPRKSAFEPWPFNGLYPVSTDAKRDFDLVLIWCWNTFLRLFGWAFPWKWCVYLKPVYQVMSSQPNEPRGNLQNKLYACSNCTRELQLWPRGHNT